MGNISIILRRPPYGTVDASEAIRHALGGVTNDMSVKLILVDGGVTIAKKGQNTEATEYLNMESGLADCIDMGAEVFADQLSLVDHDLKKEDIVEGVKVADAAEIAEVLKQADSTMIF